MFKYAGVRITYRGSNVDVKFHFSSGREHLKDGKFCPAYDHDPEDDKVVTIFKVLPKAMSRNDAIRFIIDDPKFAEVRSEIMSASKSPIVLDLLQARFDELTAEQDESVQ